MVARGTEVCLFQAELLSDDDLVGELAAFGGGGAITHVACAGVAAP